MSGNGLNQNLQSWWEPAVDSFDQEHPRFVFIGWSGGGSTLVQIYLDEELHDVVVPGQDQFVHLGLDRTHARTVRVATTDVSGVWVEQSGGLGGSGLLTARVDAVLHRQPDSPVGARWRVRVDDQVVWDELEWDCVAGRPGFGGVFGLGDFGFEMGVGPGWELAPFGYGPFGCGGGTFCVAD